MRIECHPVLMELAVFLKAREGRNLEGRLHQVTDRLYALPAGRARDEAFMQANAALFREWQLASPIETLLAERPLLGAGIARCLIGPGKGNAISAELLSKRESPEAVPEDRTLVILAAPPSLFTPEQASGGLRRDLLRICDMLDPAFGFIGSDFKGPVARQNLVRDRCKVIWDLNIEGRLVEEGRSPVVAAEALKGPLARVFSLDPGEDRLRVAFDRIMHTRSLTQARILGWAGDPGELFLGGGAGLSRQGTGTPCPVCEFPTCDWFNFEVPGGAELLHAVQLSRPDWEPVAGICRQCVDLLMASEPHSRLEASSIPLACAAG